MKYFVIYLHIIFMLQSTQIAAQKKLKLPIQWQVATELPPLENQIKSLGFAGPIAGVIKDKLVIAGGANFPDAMPWLGGRKNITMKCMFIQENKSCFQKKLNATANETHCTIIFNLLHFYFGLPSKQRD